jgi:hypothetical protein
MTTAMAGTPVIDLIEGYSAKKAWGIKDLSSASWESVLGLNASDEAIKQYLHFFPANPIKPASESDATCLRKCLCKINYAEHALVKECEKL